jgi:outer membrane protein assembly factor BamB
MRSLLVLTALVGLLAACGEQQSAKRRPEPAAAKTKKPQAVPSRPAGKPRKVQVAVIDGDTRARVRGALVRIGPHAARADGRGVARVPLRRRAALPVYVTAPGYVPHVARIQFRRRPIAAVRVYQRALQWTMYGATPTRDQVHTAIRLRPPFRVVWSHNLHALIEFPAVVYEGVAYLTNLHGILFALSMRSGKTVWRYDLGHGEQDSSPAIWGDRLVVHSKGGRIYVFNRRTGRVLWSYGTAGLVESSPVVRNGIDYLGDWAGNVYAVDLRRRRLLWRTTTGAKITSSASLRGTALFLGDYAGHVVALDARTGRLRWERSVNGRVYGTAAVAAGRIFVPSSDGNSLTAFTAAGRELWRIATGSYVYSSPAVWRGHVYFGDYGGTFYCVSARSGRILWRVGVGGRISGAPTIVAGVAYVASFAHRIVGVNARTGRVLFRFPHGEYVPVSGNGGRLLLHGYSRVFAVEPR